jgi:DNA repair exonuclease SbcCD nuclease subunit
MERTKYPHKKKATAILCGDFHLREDQPICRTDDFWKAQWGKVDYINRLSKENDDCPIIIPGDLYNHWKPSPYLLTETMKHCVHPMLVVYGQHDLPQWNIKLADKCGLNTLQTAGKVTILPGTHWGTDPDKATRIAFFLRDVDDEAPPHRIIVWHITTYSGKLPWPGCTALTAKEILAMYPDIRLIVTGDNHRTFVDEIEGRLLVNPGSLTRQDADQADHKPCVYLWYAATNDIKIVYLPCHEGVISREHIAKKEERDARIDEFVNRLSAQWQVGMSFEQNLDEFEKTNNISKDVMSIIRKAIE